MKNHRIPSTVLILLAVPGTALARTALQGQQHPVIVSALFEPPTQDELDTILAQWDARDTRGLNWVVEAEGTYAGRQLDVVSHTVDGERHYAAVRYPATPGASHPVLLLNHGGAQGAPVGPLLQLFDDLTAGACAEDEYVVVVPSYRPQTLAMPAGWVPDPDLAAFNARNTTT